MNFLELKIPPPGYMLFFAGFVWWMADLFPQFNLLPDFLEYVGWGIILLAGLSDLWSLGLFLKLHTTPNPWTPKNSKHLVTSGLYQYTRNPMYVGLMLILFGWILIKGNILGFLCIPAYVWILTRLQIIPEERILSEKFGDTYHNYLKTTPRWLW